MKKLISIALFFVSSLFTSLVLADQAELQDQRIVQKVKQKKYLNGAEEGELQIQAQLFKPQRKISPVVEQPEEDQSNARD